MTSLRVHARRRRFAPAIPAWSAALVFLFWATASGQVITRIADTSTQAPGSTGPFYVANGAPAIENGTVVFDAWPGPGDSGLFIWRNGSLSKLADDRTPIAGAVKPIIFESPVLSGNNVASQGIGQGFSRSIDAFINGQAAQQVAPQSKSPPKGIVGPALSGNDVFLVVGGILYRYDQGTMTPLVDGSTPIPGGAGTFSNVNSDIVAAKGNVAFVWDGPGRGIYATTGNSVIPLVTTSTPVVGGGRFLSFDNQSLGYDGATAVFHADLNGTEDGVFTVSGGQARIVALNNTPAPGGGTFLLGLNGSAVVSVSQGHVAFQDPRGPIYTDLTGTLSRVVAPGDVLFGKTIQTVDFGDEGLSGDQIAFGAQFTDGSSGEFIDTVPEPAVLPLFGVAGLALSRRRATRVTLSRRRVTRFGPR